MKIKDWEKYIFKKYKAEKIDNFLDLKKYLTYKDAYSQNFTPEKISEGEIENEEFYSAYAFDEDKIAKRNVQTKDEFGWKKLIVLISTKDNVTILNYSINTAGGLTEQESLDFYRDIDPLQKEK